MSKRVLQRPKSPPRADKARTPIRASKMGRWRALVLIGVHVLIGLHIAHWLTTGETITPVEPSEAMAFSQSSIINAGLIFFAAMILLTAIFGRFFCGWGCHVLALQDWCRHLMLKVGITPRPLKTRTLVWVPTLAFLYMFIWPLVYRIWIGDSLALRGTEFTTAHFWATFPGWIVGGLTFLICGFACVYFLGSKGFCTYACPYGAIFAGADRLAPMRIRVTDACSQCGHCTAVCSSNVRVHEEVRDWGMVVSPGCMKCQDCVSVCPKGALYYGAGTIPLFAKPKVERAAPPPRRTASHGWRHELVLVVGFVVSFLIVRGLYGVVPFLMSLGVAAVVAFLLLTTVRLTLEPTVEQSGLRLKRSGKLLPQGRAFVAVMVVLGAFLAHSAVLRVQLAIADNAYATLEPLRRSLLAAPGQVPVTPEWAGAAIDEGRDALGKVEAWGLFPTLGNSAKLAWLHALAGADQDSARRAREAIERGELAAEMQQLLAHAALLRADVPAALAAWQAAVMERPDLPEPWLAYGLHLARSGDLLMAREIFDRGAMAVGDSAELYYNAALARALDGQVGASVEWFERALARNPRYREARENLAGVQASLGNFEAAAGHYRTALEQAPEDVQTRLLLARVLLALNDREAALRELRRVLEIEPENVQARAFLAEIGSD
jgi:polyferredoxin/Tfp pilus assembly protein PilF